MSNKNLFTATLARINPYKDSAGIPLTFCYGEKSYRGLSEEFFIRWSNLIWWTLI